MPQPVHPLTNYELADIFERIGNLLEIKGEVIYKILAYRKAADSLRANADEATDLFAEDRLTDIPGVGKAISEKISELFTTGRLGFLEKLEAEIPPTLPELLQVPDVGPRKAALLWKQANITNMAELEAAARAGKLRDLPSIGEKSEQRILAGIEAVSRRSTRMTLDVAYAQVERWVNWLREQPGVERAEAAGSLRRWKTTVGDFDLVAAANDAQPVMTALTARPGSAYGIGRRRQQDLGGTQKRCQAAIVDPAARALRQPVTVCHRVKDHNVRVRELAQKRGLSLSERGFLKQDGGEILCATEEEVYAALGMDYIEPELREERGEVQAALAHRLPELIELKDLRAELHAHSTWSDGSVSIEEMARAAIQRGLGMLVISDHSAGLGVAGGLP